MGATKLLPRQLGGIVRGRRGGHVATHGDTWRHMAIHGDTWRHMATHGDTRRHMATQKTFVPLDVILATKLLPRQLGGIVRGRRGGHVATHGDARRHTVTHGDTWR